MSNFKAKSSTFESDYNGKKYPVISIYEFDEEGFQKYKKSTITIGLKKAKAILATIDDIKKFVEENMTEEEMKAVADAEIAKILTEENDGTTK
jgi:hypothetical protein